MVSKVRTDARGVESVPVSEEKRHQCPKCPANFVDESNLQWHLTRAHGPAGEARQAFDNLSMAAGKTILGMPTDLVLGVLAHLVGDPLERDRRIVMFCQEAAKEARAPSGQESESTINLLNREPAEKIAPEQEWLGEAEFSRLPETCPPPTTACGNCQECVADANAQYLRQRGRSESELSDAEKTAIRRARDKGKPDDPCPRCGRQLVAKASGVACSCGYMFCY